MTTITVSDIPLASDSPAQRLRRSAAAVRVAFTWWGIHKTLTTQQKEEVSSAYGADARFLRAGKKLIDNRHDAFRKLTSVRTAIVSFWRGLTLPFTEAGVRLIRQSDIEMFVHKMEDFRQDLTQAEADLNAVYIDIKADARRRLGRLFNSTDYPPELRGLFNVEHEFPSVEPPNYLMRLNPEIYAEEQARVARRFEEAVQLAEQAFISDFAKLVSHLTERLSSSGDNERKIFRDSAITNISEFFERFRTLNVRSNSQLDELVAQAQRVVRGVEPQALRDNTALRQHVVTQLAGVQATLDGMMVDRPRRRILRSNSSTNGAAHAVED